MPSTFFLDFLELFVPQVLEYAEPSELSFEPTETVREVFSPIAPGRKKIADVVAKLSFRDQEACFLVHVESQSNAYSDEDFRWRMFNYCARLHEKYRLPVYPIALFTFDEPFQEQENRYEISFPDRQVLDFNFVSIQLNRLNWRDFLKRENPLASALMAKMRIAPSDRPKVKAECLRLLATLELNPDKMELISGFIGTYLRLNQTEEQQFQQEIEEMELLSRNNTTLFATDWQERGREQGLQEGRQEGLQEGRQEGLQEGRQEGLQEGRQEGQILNGQESVLRILEVRFEEIPEQLREQIDRISDLEVLGTLLVQAVTAQSLQTFESIASQAIAALGEANLPDGEGQSEIGSGENPTLGE